MHVPDPGEDLPGVQVTDSAQPGEGAAAGLHGVGDLSVRDADAPVEVANLGDELGGQATQGARMVHHFRHREARRRQLAQAVPLARDRILARYRAAAAAWLPFGASDLPRRAGECGRGLSGRAPCGDVWTAGGVRQHLLVAVLAPHDVGRLTTVAQHRIPLDLDHLTFQLSPMFLVGSGTGAVASPVW